MTSKWIVYMSLSAASMLSVSCGGPTAPSPETSTRTSALSPSSVSTEEPSAEPTTNAVEFDCSELQEVAVRFGPPGSIDGIEVVLYARFTGAPAGEKILRIWWDLRRDGARFQDVRLGEGEVQRANDSRFDLEALIEHTYVDLTERSEVVVRAALIIEGRPGGCSRNRHITITPPSKPAGTANGCANVRFCKQGDGTVLDNRTGLLWLENPGCTGARRWQTATNLTAALAGGQCGLSDGSTPGQWRLPTESELQSLLDPRFGNPMLSNAAGDGPWSEGDAFRGVRSRFYWTSDTVAACLGQLPGARIVHLGDGRTNCRITSLGFAFFWPVR